MNLYTSYLNNPYKPLSNQDSYQTFNDRSTKEVDDYKKIIHDKLSTYLEKNEDHITCLSECIIRNNWNIDTFTKSFLDLFQSTNAISSLNISEDSITCMQYCYKKQSLNNICEEGLFKKVSKKGYLNFNSDIMILKFGERTIFITNKDNSSTLEMKFKGKFNYIHSLQESKLVSGTIDCSNGYQESGIFALNETTQKWTLKEGKKTFPSGFCTDGIYSYSEKMNSYYLKAGTKIYQDKTKEVGEFGIIEKDNTFTIKCINYFEKS